MVKAVQVVAQARQTTILKMIMPTGPPFILYKPVNMFNQFYPCNRISFIINLLNVTFCFDSDQPGHNTSGSQSGDSNVCVGGSGGSIGHSSLNATRGSLMSMISGSASTVPLGKPSSSTLVSLAGILSGGNIDSSSGTTSNANVNLPNITPTNRPKMPNLSQPQPRDLPVAEITPKIKVSLNTV